MKKAIKLPARRAADSAPPVSAAEAPGSIDEAALLGDLRTLVQSARQRIATAANSTYTLLCWQVGRRLLTANLQSGRAAYGKQILAPLSLGQVPGHWRTVRNGSLFGQRSQTGRKLLQINGL